MQHPATHRKRGAATPPEGRSKGVGRGRQTRDGGRHGGGGGGQDPAAGVRKGGGRMLESGECRRQLRLRGKKCCLGVLSILRVCYVDLLPLPPRHASRWTRIFCLRLYTSHTHTVAKAFSRAGHSASTLRHARAGLAAQTDAETQIEYTVHGGTRRWACHANIAHLRPPSSCPPCGIFFVVVVIKGKRNRQP